MSVFRYLLTAEVVVVAFVFVVFAILLRVVGP
jgi:hypothetical protein